MKMVESDASVEVNRSSTYYYFSYGSNMLKERITINDANATPYAAAKLDVGELIYIKPW